MAKRPHTVRLDTRTFVINTLRAIAGNAKNPAQTRLRALDRIAVMETYYPVHILAAATPDANRKLQSPQTGVDEGVEQMLRQLKEESNAELSTSQSG